MRDPKLEFMGNTMVDIQNNIVWTMTSSKTLSPEVRKSYLKGIIKRNNLIPEATDFLDRLVEVMERPVRSGAEAEIFSEEVKEQLEGLKNLIDKLKYI